MQANSETTEQHVDEVSQTKEPNSDSRLGVAAVESEVSSQSAQVAFRRSFITNRIW
jgi:hypothetical protein